MIQAHHNKRHGSEHDSQVGGTVHMIYILSSSSFTINQHSSLPESSSLKSPQATLTFFCATFISNRRHLPKYRQNPPSYNRKPTSPPQLAETKYIQQTTPIQPLYQPGSTLQKESNGAKKGYHTVCVPIVFFFQLVFCARKKKRKKHTKH